MSIKGRITAVIISAVSALGMIWGNGCNLIQQPTIIVSAAKEYEYSSDYIYNVLETDAEREFYDRLDSACKTVQNSYNTYTSTPYARYSDLIDYERAVEIAWLFYYDQPEYFWISSSFRISATGGVSFGIYNEYTIGSQRQAALENIMAEVQTYIDGANNYATDYEKVKFLRDELLANVDYVEGTYDQSIASTFLLRETVCAGYTKAYSMLCNALGINAVSITGFIHGWNAVEIYGIWYFVDVTNDNYNYDLFLVSEKAFEEYDVNYELIYTVTKTDSSGTEYVIESYMHEVDSINFPTYYDDYPYCALNFKDVLIPIKEADKGDITCDGMINLYDAIEIARYIMHIRSFNDDEFTVADYNGDGEVNLYDVIEIARLIMG